MGLSLTELQQALQMQTEHLMKAFDNRFNEFEERERKWAEERKADKQIVLVKKKIEIPEKPEKKRNNVVKRLNRSERDINVRVKELLRKCIQLDQGRSERFERKRFTFVKMLTVDDESDQIFEDRGQKFRKQEEVRILTTERCAARNQSLFSFNDVVHEKRDEGGTFIKTSGSIQFNATLA